MDDSTNLLYYRFFNYYFPSYCLRRDGTQITRHYLASRDPARRRVDEPRPPIPRARRHPVLPGAGFGVRPGQRSRARRRQPRCGRRAAARCRPRRSDRASADPADRDDPRLPRGGAITIAAREARLHAGGTKGRKVLSYNLGELREAGLARVLAAPTLFELGNLATSLLILRATVCFIPAAGASTAATSLAVLMYAAHNLAATVSAVASGHLIDHASPRPAMAIAAGDLPRRLRRSSRPDLTSR